jgi:hypothetical protein
MNLYLSQFKRGWSHTAIYLLRTRSNETANERYAIYKIDYTPKQAAHYLHNLATILDDNVSVSSPGQVNYSIPGQPATVHDLLLKKSDGKFELVVWSERFTGGSDNVTINLDTTYATVKVYDTTIGTSPMQTLTDVSRVMLSLSDHPVIIEIMPQGAINHTSN